MGVGIGRERHTSRRMQPPTSQYSIGLARRLGEDIHHCIHMHSRHKGEQNRTPCVADRPRACEVSRVHRGGSPRRPVRYRAPGADHWIEDDGCRASGPDLGPIKTPAEFETWVGNRASSADTKHIISEMPLYRQHPQKSQAGDGSAEALP